MNATRLTDLLGIEHPILQAGMGRETRAELVAAVSEAGGLGNIGAGSWPVDWVREQIRRTRDLTTKPFAVNLLLPFVGEEQVELLLEERVPVVSTSWGDPAPYVERSHEAGALVMHMVQTVEEAEDAVAKGVDIVMAQGTDAGGHVNTFGLGTLSLVPQVRDAIGDHPLAAAGGIVDGRTAAACLALGADAVVCGTLFLATPEANISDGYREALLAGRSHDPVVSEVPDIAENNTWPPGAAIRLLPNDLIREWSGREDELREKRDEVVREMEAAAKEGRKSHLVLCAGQGVGAVHELFPAAVVVERLAQQIEETLEDMGRLVSRRDAHADAPHA